jgi:hypothetical protein
MYPQLVTYQRPQQINWAKVTQVLTVVSLVLGIVVSIRSLNE